jgi:hypothetical protein
MGLPKRTLDLIRDGGIEGKTLLEVGRGIGAVEIELLKAGMGRAVNVELTPTYEAAAGDLLVEARNGIPPIRSRPGIEGTYGTGCSESRLLR